MQLRLRLFSTLLFLLYAGISADAAPRTASEAKRLAQQYFTSQAISLRNTPQKAASLTLSLESAPKMSSALLRATGAQTADACYYFVYNRGEGEGFVIVSGDDRLAPYIGFSDTGRFASKDMPDNLAAFLEQCRITIDALLASGDADALRALEPQPLSGLRSGEEPLLNDIQWNQNYPWNNQTPVDSYGEHLPVGCVATAYSQIMRYYKWPDRGTGSHTYTDTYGTGETLKVNFETDYDWANMTGRLLSPNAASEAEVKALSTLAYHAGVAVNMMYAKNGSGAYSPHVLRALRDFFRYDKGLTMKCRANFTQEEWNNLIKAQLDAKRPVFYGGSGSGGGHAFVCDGYNAKGYFHFNWGWSGLSNGYFNLNYLVPSKMGIGGGAGGGFSQGQEVIVDIFPDKDGTSKEYDDTHLVTDKLFITLKDVDKALMMKVKSTVWLYENYKYDGRITMAATRVGSQDTVWMEDIADDLNFDDIFQEATYTIEDFDVTKILTEGDWEIFVAHKATHRDGTKYWRANVPIEYELVSRFFSIKKNEDGSYEVNKINNPSRYDLKVDLESLDYSFNQYSYSTLSVNITNKGTKEFHGLIYLMTKDGDSFRPMQIGNAIPALAPNKTEVLSYVIGRFPFSSNTHEYALCYVDEYGNPVYIDLPEMKVTPETDYDPAIVVSSVKDKLLLGLDERKLTPIALKKVGNWKTDDNSAYMRWELTKKGNSQVHYESDWIQIVFEKDNIVFTPEVPSSFLVRQGDVVYFDITFLNSVKSEFVAVMEHPFLTATVAQNLPAEKIEKTINSVRIFPNPANRETRVTGVAPGSEVRIYGVDGALLQQTVAGTDGNLTLLLSALPEGQYLVTLYDKDNNLCTKPLTISR